jgi:hypothetical protein
MLEADPFATANDGYFIVVAGNMNPAIHHPGFYKLIGVLSDDELAGTGVVPGKSSAPEPAPPGAAGGLLRAFSGANTTICTPALAQFTAGKIRIACGSNESSQEPHRSKNQKRSRGIAGRRVSICRLRFHGLRVRRRSKGTEADAILLMANPENLAR